ncbi:transcription factor mef2A-like [Ctenocephalides felis]|uniref:transcription factor mef2A-like n=1 Tax=Ctenocephalides felis TaxID=7515 RepID=UPI000E6E3319|nr:transcription factor mef2A-like [Ctenocephalides felis]XP_026463216.1 transcription factor mef2A-like [Ctenocephalides felis]
MLKEEDSSSNNTSTTPNSNSTSSTNSSLRCVACDSERQRTGWLTAMRLAKYGKQLRENYRAFKNKSETMQNKDYATYAITNDSLRSRVAMDFTGAQGRIVEDPAEALAVADAEGCSWRRRWRPTQRKQPPPFSDRDNRFIMTNSSNIIPNRNQHHSSTNSSPSSQQLSPSNNHLNHHHGSAPGNNTLYLNHHSTATYNSGTTPPTSIQLISNHHVSRRQQQMMGSQFSKSPTGNSVLMQNQQNYQQNMSHLTKQWFHPGVTREQAAAILVNRQTPPTGDGIFLVRESRSSPTRGHFVLTYRHAGRACHAHIRPMLEQSQNDNTSNNSNTSNNKNDSRNNINNFSNTKGTRQSSQSNHGSNCCAGNVVYSLDGGETKFYDLQQLIEFYQLNTTSGALPVKLTNYVSRDDVTRHRTQDSGSY